MNIYIYYQCVSKLLQFRDTIKSINKSMEIVTVTCTRDKWCLALQSYTLEKYVKEPCIHYVIIEDDKTNMHEWEELLFPLYKNHTLVLITKESYPHIYPTSNEIGGWHKQQIIKFLAHQLINHNKNYIVFDSKNIFIRPIKLENFRYEGCGSTIKTSDEWMQYWMPWLKYLSQKLSKPIPNSVWFPITPFVLNKEIVQNLLQTCDFETMAIDATRKNMAVSEFLLYAFFTDGYNQKTIPYGGGFQGGNLKEIYRHFANIQTFAIGRKDLQDIKKRRTIESVLISIGLDSVIVSNAVNYTTL